jgi:hypothetical protein
MTKFFLKFILTLALSTLFILPTTFAEDVIEQTDESQESTARTPQEIEYQEKLELIIPSQESLFDSSKRLDTNNNGVIEEGEKLRLADGDLEQGLAPRVLRILIAFSGIGFFVLFTYTGVRLILSRGNEETYAALKDQIVQLVIGTALISASFGIILGVIRFFNNI